MVRRKANFVNEQLKEELVRNHSPAPCLSIGLYRITINARDMGRDRAHSNVHGSHNMLVRNARGHENDGVRNGSPCR